MVAIECNKMQKYSDDQPTTNFDCCLDNVSYDFSQTSSSSSSCQSSLVYKFNENLYYGTRSHNSSGNNSNSNPTLTHCTDSIYCCNDAMIAEQSEKNWFNEPSLCFCNQIVAERHRPPNVRIHRHEILRKKLLNEQFSHFQILQTYATVKYILMITILISIVDGLFILGYQQQFIRDLQFSIWFRRKQSSSDYSRLILFDEQRLRVATGSLYLVNVFIQFVGLFGVNSDRLMITSSYAIYSCLCFLFTIGAYITCRRLIISLCINAILAILSIMFAIFIKKFQHIRFNQKTFSV